MKRSVVFPEYIQANILKPHGRKYTKIISLRLVNDEVKIRQFVDNLIRKCSGEGGFIMTHMAQIKNTIKYKESIDECDRKSENRFVSPAVVTFGLSYSGYKKLKVNDREIPLDRAFRLGFSGIRNQLPWYPSEFEDDYRVRKDRSIDAIITISDVNVKVLEKRYLELLSSVCVEDVLDDQVENSRIEENGFSLPESTYEEPIGPFGYRDDLSKKRSIIDVSSVALHREDYRFLEGSRDNVYPYGSFLFFIKIKLNYQAFNGLVSEIANHCNLIDVEDKIALAKALVMGRFQNGVPLMLEGLEKVSSNEQRRYYVDMPFDYLSDGLAKRCPFNAHIRVVNPRESGPKTAEIVRRGVFYNDDSDETGGKGGVSGLLFMSYQKSLDKNLMPILKRIFSGKRVDPISYGGSGKIEIEIPREYVKSTADPSVISFREKLITYLGGEFFYMPSIDALKKYE